MASTLVFAHRGAPLEAAENSRAAFAQAFVRPTDGAETDIQLSADGVPVLWHDEDLEKIGLPGIKTRDRSLEALRRMDFTGWFDGGPAGAGILSLEELLAEFKDTAAWLLEIKHFPDESDAGRRLKVERSLDCARRHPSRPGIRFSSFDPETLRYAHSLSAAYPYILNAEHIRSARDALSVFAADPFLAGLCVPAESLDGELAQAMRALQKTLAVYACDGAEEIALALDLGVDLLITDRLDLALAMRARSRRQAS